MVPILVLVLLLVAVAVLCSYGLRNTSGSRGTSQPGAMAGNLAVVFVAVVVGGLVLVALFASR